VVEGEVEGGEMGGKFEEDRLVLKFFVRMEGATLHGYSPSQNCREGGKVETL
jgi:hypothetical protein